MKGLMWLSMSLMLAGGEAPLILYGPEAPAEDGDEDHREQILLRVPASGDELFLRIYDPGCGGDEDAIRGSADTATRFSLYAGSDVQGTPLFDETIADEPGTDGSWLTLYNFPPDDEERAFTLEVMTVRGDDGNLYRVALSTRSDRNTDPPGVEIWCLEPTFRLEGSGAAELRAAVPVGTAPRVRSFDAAGARLSLETATRGYELTTSGQGDAAEASATLEPEEADAVAVLLRAGVRERPNDVGVRLARGDGTIVPIRLPIRVGPANQRPEIAYRVVPLEDCNGFSFDARASTDADGDRLSFDWDFGDGTSGQGDLLTHRFPQPGSYSVQLRVSDDSGRLGCADETRFDITVNHPPIAEAGPARVIAPGEPLLLDATESRDEDGSLTRFVWLTGDGTTLEGASVEHAYSQPGRYRVILTVWDDTGTPCDHATDETTVWVNAPPTAVAGEDLFVIAGETVTLDGHASHDRDGTLLSWTWDWGDLESGAVVRRIFPPGSHRVRLTVTDDAGTTNSRADDTLIVTVNHDPIARVAIPAIIGAGEPVLFDGSGSRDPDGSIRRYAWDFGDGTMGEGARATHAYAVPGTYEVRLRVTDDFPKPRSDEADATIRVNASPRADAGADRVVTASTVSFDGHGSRDPDGAPLSFQWDFGDGARGTGPRPSHTYRAPGRYRVQLTVDDGTGTGNATHTAVTHVTVNARPAADAGFDRRVAPDEEVVFEAFGSRDPDGEIVTYAWSLGDGTLTEGRRVVHRYAEPGRYAVVLTVRDESDHDIAHDRDEISVLVNQAPRARSLDEVLTAPGVPFRLEGEGSDPDGTITDYEWVLPDGRVLEGATVETTLEQPGSYTATLTVFDDSGTLNGYARAKTRIRVNAAPIARPGPAHHTCSRTVVFDGRDSRDPDGDPLSYHWDFGDGTAARGARVSHTYTEGGTFQATLTVDDGTGTANAHARARRVVTVERPPIARVGENRTVCTGASVVFDAGDSSDPDGGPLRYRWDFGDGRTSSQANPVMVFEDGGLYAVTLEVTDTSGLPCGVDSDQLLLRVVDAPVAIAGEDREICANTRVRFDGTASSDPDGVVNAFAWDFGDGRRGGGPNPEHSYSEPGTYTVTLEVTGDRVGDCPNTDRDELTVVVRPAPSVAISGPSSVAADRETVWQAQLADLEGAEPITWEWRLSDVVLGTEPELTHAFTEPGERTLTVRVSTDARHSCAETTAALAVFVNKRPIADAGPDRHVATGEPVVFSARGSSDEDGEIAAYRWDFGDGTSANGAEVRHVYREPGRYRATLTVRDGADVANSEASTTVAVHVNHPPIAVIEGPDRGCPGEPILFDGTASGDEDGERLRLTWSAGDGQRGSGDHFTPVFDAPGSYTVTLWADDGSALANAVGVTTHEIAINHPPRPRTEATVRGCAGVPVTLEARGSRDEDGDSLSWTWKFEDSSTATGAEVTTEFDEPGRQTVRLEVDDGTGTPCAVQSVETTVVINHPPIADAGGDREAFFGGANDAVFFDADASRDADGDNLLFTWDFGDGTTIRGKQVFHTFTRPGEHLVTLEADDGSGLPCSIARDVITVRVRAHE